MGTKPLEGVTIICASIAEAGPAASEVLAFLGAEVYHIERPLTQPTPRYAGSILRNANKKALTLNCKEPEGKELLWKLLERADVFLENFAPGAWEHMGFSYEEVKKRVPEIIYVSIKGYRKDSRWGGSIAYDPVGAAYGGLTSLCGYEDMDPMMCGINASDSGLAVQTAMTIMMAVLQKKLTGKGQYIESSLADCVTATCRSAFVDYYEHGCVPPRRVGNSCKTPYPTAPYNIYPTQGTDTQGNHIMITCKTDEDFRRLCEAIDRPDLLSDPRYATRELRYQNRRDLDAEITKWTYRRDKYEAMDILAGEYGVPAGAVMSPGDICSDDYLVGTILQDVPDPRIGSFRMPIVPINMSSHKITAVSCGEHGDGNEEVYCGVLGMTKDELTALQEKKII